MDPFKAYLVEQQDGKIAAASCSSRPEQFDRGEVTLRIAYSSINYKDALAATGGQDHPPLSLRGRHRHGRHRGRERRRPVQAGRQVIATSYDIGVAHHGGYAEYGRVPADWVVPLPAGMSLYESMALGTAGFTAALASCAWRTTAWRRRTAR